MVSMSIWCDLVSMPLEQGLHFDLVVGSGSVIDERECLLPIAVEEDDERVGFLRFDGCFVSTQN